MPRSIAFHSYKGGTGKTTIAANLAALLARQGSKVLLTDFDVYAPSLYLYFGQSPGRWINDYLFGKAELKDVLVDLTGLLERTAQKGQGDGVRKINGQLLAAFSDPRKDEIYKLDLTPFNPAGQSSMNLQVLRRFIKLREEAIMKYDIDYMIIDTSPGIKYWSINSLAIADTLILTLKMDDLDIESTMKLASEVYSSFSELGTKSYLLLNRVSGYCVPDSLQEKHHADHSALSQYAYMETGLEQAKSTLETSAKMEIISAIPCYCDIQFSRREFLTSLNYPYHAFTRQLHDLAQSKHLKV